MDITASSRYAQEIMINAAGTFIVLAIISRVLPH